MALTDDFLKSKGFTITDQFPAPNEWKDAVNGGIKLLKRPGEEWTIAIEHDHDYAEEFWLTDEQQIIDLLNALTKWKRS